MQCIWAEQRGPWEIRGGNKVCPHRGGVGWGGRVHVNGGMWQCGSWSPLLCRFNMLSCTVLIDFPCPLEWNRAVCLMKKQECHRWSLPQQISFSPPTLYLFISLSHALSFWLFTVSHALFFWLFTPRIKICLFSRLYLDMILIWLHLPLVLI